MLRPLIIPVLLGTLVGLLIGFVLALIWTKTSAWGASALFWNWIQNPVLYWPFPLFGAVMAVLITNLLDMKELIKARDDQPKD